MTTEEKLEKIKKLADAMYYAAQQLTTDASRLQKAMDEYHKFIIYECKEEPVSEELEEAANEYAKDYLFTPKPQRAPNIHFINGANWQKRKDESYTKSMYKVGINTGKELMKQQMMTKAVDVTIAIPYQNGYGGYTQLVDSKEGLPFGDNIKVLVIKED